MVRYSGVQSGPSLKPINRSRDKGDLALFTKASTIDLPFQSRTVTPLQRRVSDGTHLFRENDEAVHVYEIKIGVVRLIRALKNGRREVIAFGLAGDIIGFPDGDRHHSDCNVIATADIIVHQRCTLESGNGNPQIHKHLLRAALNEISAMQDHFMMLARKSTLEKAASFLRALSQRTGTPLGAYTTFALPIPRGDFADSLGLTTETASRAFSALPKAEQS